MPPCASMEAEVSSNNRTGTRGSTWNIFRNSFSSRMYARQLTARRSSPWWKLRWSRNSWPAPGKRDLLWPPTSPAKDFCQWMVRRSSFSRNSRSSNGADAIRYLRGSLRADALENGLQNGFRRLPVRMGVEVQNNAVPQHGSRHVEDVFHGQVEPSAHQGMHAAALHQSLRAARGTAI